MSRMYNPPHPGAVLKDTVLGAGRLSVTAFAEQLRVTRVTMSKGSSQETEIYAR
jgi:plasmid maintenance system antidote protein VapI